MSKKKAKGVARIFGGVVVTLFLVSSIVGCGESAPKEPTPTPTPPPSVSYQFLLAEREANATRFDSTYKGKYVELDERVIGIDGGNVMIAGPSGFLDDGVIEDLPDDVQMQLDKGQRIKIVCRVGAYIMGAMYFDSCINLGEASAPPANTETSTATAATSAPATDSGSTAEPVATPTLEEPTATPTPPEPTPTPTPAGIQMGLPADVTVEASSSAGTVFAFALPLAHGGVGNVTVACDAAPGVLFPIGETKVSCTATDGTQAETGDFTVTVVDSTPPILTEPVAVVVTAAFGQTTATAQFPSPNGIDVVGGPVTAACNPASGTPFAVGTTIVTCTASDPTGNEAVATFNVEVLEGEVPRDFASGCPASGQASSFPPIPMFVRGAATLDGATAADGTLVFVRLTNATLGAALRQCDSDPVAVENGQFTLTLTPPEVSAPWFTQLRFFVDGRPASASGAITSGNYAGGSFTTINLDAFTP